MVEVEEVEEVEEAVVVEEVEQGGVVEEVEEVEEAVVVEEVEDGMMEEEEVKMMGMCCHLILKTFSKNSANSLTASLLFFFPVTAISSTVSCRNLAICSFTFSSFFLRAA